MNKALLERLHGTRVFGFTGSRAPDAFTAVALQGLVDLIRPSNGFEERSGIVGDSRGVDSIVTQRWRQHEDGATPSTLRIFYQNPSIRPVAARLIHRSTLMVRALAVDAPHALLIAGPSKACPITIKPAERWISGFGDDGLPDVSGTWSSVGLAVGLGLPCLLYLPLPYMPPAAYRGWAWEDVTERWWWHPGLEVTS